MSVSCFYCARLGGRVETSSQVDPSKCRARGCDVKGLAEKRCPECGEPFTIDPPDANDG